MGFLEKIFGSYTEKEIKRLWPQVDAIVALSPKFEAMSDAELRGMTDVLKGRLAAGESLDDILPEAFAAVREAAWRVLGMRHFPVQLLGGIVLHQGRIAEMKTGEGKTLVATLPAYLNALTGEGVHVVTVNEYLARRDSEWMGKIYTFLGLTVGLVVHGGEDKKAAYAADITYGTNNEFGFDYLRDNMVIRKELMTQRGHAFAIVDEVDSILIDEARTPLIISGQGEKSTELYSRADRFVGTLRACKIIEKDTKALYDDVDADYLVDEKHKSVELTKSGIQKAERYFGVDNITDPEQSLLYHHINQALKAHAIMHRDIDYVVRNGEVIIVDEFTGRLMFGRRYSEGLHQAIEAKENVSVASESRTLATITFQNYFRMYKKLSGMTGTALTEEQEFKEIYRLDVIPIPTNRPMIRQDLPDAVYRTERAKFNAVIEQVADCHSRLQPVLVGTVSIEKSEQLSALLKKRGIAHQVLNAKHHEREAEIIAQAGKPGSVTIATNMAGRGTDIILGGNAEYMAKADMRKDGLSEELISASSAYFETDDEEILDARRRFSELVDSYKERFAADAGLVKEQGGLFIIGTERHESRRIDNQLRGRSGRQGDPGMSRFYLSLEDDLMRLFGAEKIIALVDSLGLEEDVPIEHKMLSGAIESAQSKVESRNFDIRKHVLQYDDVMNQQREIIYAQRRQVLDGEDIHPAILSMIKFTVDDTVDRYTGENPSPEDWDFDAIRRAFSGMFLDENDLRYTVDDFNTLTKQDVKDYINQKALAAFERRAAELGPVVMPELERVALLSTVDRKWMAHIDDMDQLRRGIGLRAYGQHDPVQEYKFEGADMFDEMINSIKTETVRFVFLARVNAERPPERRQAAKPNDTGSDGTAAKTPVRTGKKVGRNDPCPCGSGLKYKKCCGRNA